MKLKAGILTLVLIIGQVAFADTVRSCRVPEVTTIVYRSDGPPKHVQNTSRRKFLEDESVRFQVNAPLTGYYTAVFIENRKFKQESFGFFTPKDTFIFPPCKGDVCGAYSTTKHQSNQKFDDILILYTPCKLGETALLKKLKRSISNDLFARIPNCEDAQRPSFSNSELSLSFESRVSTGCPSLRNPGSPTFKKRIDIEFRD
ncbi:hypothetical protein [Sulfitobacter pacificus]|uniref:hypothetical protein n=1 Tax=Sulfitobacter pacificus TaxID=1499314 RepID=UPI003341329F